MTTHSVLPPLAGPVRLTFAGLVRSEYTKFRSMRATWWLLATVVGIIVSMALALEAPGDASGVVSASVRGVGVAQFAVALLGVLMVSGEFRTGQIRTTFNADPGRTKAIGAKAVVLILAVVVVGTAAVAASLIVLGIQAGGPPVGTVMPAIAGSVASLAFVAAVSVAVAAAAQRAGTAIIALVVLILVLPSVAIVFPVSWIEEAVAFLPFSAVSAMYSVGGSANMLVPTGTVLLPASLAAVLTVAWAVAIWTGGMAVLRRRDV